LACRVAVQAELAALTTAYEQAEAEKESTAREVAEASKKLGLAQRLMRALGDENERWAISAEHLNSRRKQLTGDVLLGA
jgi:hypothetical protein